MDSDIDIYMFLNVKGEPFQFYLHDFEEKGRITKLIEDGGGTVEEEPHGNFTIQLAAPASIQLEADINEVFSFQYVIECCARNQTVDIRKYRLNKTSVYSSRFNPTDVLQKNISWSEAYKYRLPEKIPGTENRWRINSPEKLKERKNTICSYYREKKTNASKQQRSVTSTVCATSDDDEGSYVGSTKGRKYLQTEQENIVRCIIQCKAYEHLHERDFWMRLEKKQICKNRSWESLKKQFFNKILPNIESFCTSEKRIARFKQLITVHGKKKQEKDVRRAEPEMLQTEEEDDDTYRSVTGSSDGASFIRNTKFYSEEEDKALLNFITTGKRHLEAGGVRIWKFMERKEVVPGRSWQSLKERYRKHLVKNLEKYLPKDQVDEVKYAHLKGHKNKKVKKKVQPRSSSLEKTDNSAVKLNEPARNRLPKKRKLFSQRESTDELSSNSEKDTSKELRGELNRQRTTKPLVEKTYGTTNTNVSDEGSLQNNPRESKRSQISKKMYVKHKTTTNDNMVEDGIESCGGSANNENIRNEESIALNSIEVHRHIASNDRAKINRDNVIACNSIIESCKDVNQNARTNEENVIGNTIQSNADNAVNDEISKTIQYLKTLLNHRISSTKNSVTGENSHISQSELLQKTKEYNTAQEAKGNSTKADATEVESDVSMHLATSQIVCEERQYKGNKKPQEISAIHGSDLESTETETHTPEFDSEQPSESNESFSASKAVTRENSHISQNELLRNSEEYNIAQEAKGNSTKADASEFESDVSMHLATSQIVCEERRYKGNKKPDTPKLEIYNRMKIMRQEISVIHGSDLESTETETHTPEFDSEQPSESNESFSASKAVTRENSHISQNELLRNSEEYNIAQEAKGNSTEADVSEFESDVSMHLATSQIVCEERQYKGNKKPQEISAIHGSDLESTETETHTPEFDSEQPSESNESFSASKAVTRENSHISQNELLRNSEEYNIAQEAKGNSTKADASEFESDVSMHLATSQIVCEERRYKGNKKPDTPKLEIYNRMKIMRQEISVIHGSDLESTETETHTPEFDSEQPSESNESFSASKAVTGDNSHISQNELLRNSEEYNIPQEAKGIQSNSHFVSTQHTIKTNIQDVSKHWDEMRLNKGEQDKIIERIIVSKASNNSIVCRTQKTNPQNALQERNIAVIDDSLVEALYKKVIEKMPKLKSSNLQLKLLQPPKNEFSGEILQDDAVSSTKEIQSKLKDKISSFRSGNSSQISINKSELSTCKLISNLNVIGEFPEKILTGNLSKPTELNTLQMEGINMMDNPVTDSYENIRTVYHINSMEKDPVNSSGSDHKRKTKSTLQTYQQDVHTSRETSHRYVSMQSGDQSRKKSYETYENALSDFRNKKKRRKVHETTSYESEERCSICDCDEDIEPQML